MKCRLKEYCRLHVKKIIFVSLDRERWEVSSLPLIFNRFSYLLNAKSKYVLNLLQINTFLVASNLVSISPLESYWYNSAWASPIKKKKKKSNPPFYAFLAFELFSTSINCTNFEVFLIGVCPYRSGLHKFLVVGDDNFFYPVQNAVRSVPGVVSALWPHIEKPPSMQRFIFLHLCSSQHGNRSKRLKTSNVDYKTFSATEEELPVDEHDWSITGKENWKLNKWGTFDSCSWDCSDWLNNKCLILICRCSCLKLCSPSSYYIHQYTMASEYTCSLCSHVSRTVKDYVTHCQFHSNLYRKIFKCPNKRCRRMLTSYGIQGWSLIWTVIIWTHIPVLKFTRSYWQWM